MSIKIQTSFINGIGGGCCNLLLGTQTNIVLHLHHLPPTGLIDVAAQCQSYKSTHSNKITHTFLFSVSSLLLINLQSTLKSIQTAQTILWMTSAFSLSPSVICSLSLSTS